LPLAASHSRAVPSNAVTTRLSFRPNRPEVNYQSGKRSLIRFREKGGKETAIPVHHKLEEILDE
jgi:hypothetical protein